MTDSVSPGRAFRFQALARAARTALHIIFVYWPQRRRQRMILGELSDDHLKDIGVSPAQARREAARPFWD